MALGRTVAACGFTSSPPPVFAAVTSVGTVWLDDFSCERAFLLVGFAGGGKSAAQMSRLGGLVSVEGIVKSGVSQRENGEGGSYRMASEVSVETEYGGEDVGAGGSRRALGGAGVFDGSSWSRG